MIIDLEKKINIWENDVESFISLISNPEFNTEYILMNLVSANLQIATYNLFASKNLSKSKNCYYNAGLLKILLHEKFGKNNYTSSNIFLVATGFSYCILSDSSKLINRYLNYNDNFLDTFSSVYSKAIQACIKEDDYSLHLQILQLEKHTSKSGMAKYFNGVPMAFKGIIAKDTGLIEQGIKEILNKHKNQDQPIIVKDYMNVEALTIAKLAYRRGFIVEIENQLLPKEMIPIQELDKYETYDFLKEIEATL